VESYAKQKISDSTKMGSDLRNREEGPFQQNINIDSSRNLYVSDTTNQRIRMIDISYNVTTVAGTGTAGYQDGSGNNAYFYNPQGIALDLSNNLYKFIL
jgi:hypothetical protein